MKIRYVTEKVNQNGSTESAVSEFDAVELLIGRGGNSHITLTGRTVSLVHARVFIQNGKLFVQDSGSLTGIRVNGRRVARSDIDKGDSFQVGDAKFRVISFSGEVLEIARSIDETVPPSEDAVVDAQVKRLDVRSYFPRLRVLSFTCLALVGLFYFLLPVLGTNLDSWSSGPISNSHKNFESDCNSCHAKSFTHVADKECIECHTMSDHTKDLAKLVSTHPEHNHRCADCHLEHNGDHSIVQTDPRVCTGCHNDMEKIKSDSKLLRIDSFEKHPEFRVDVKAADNSVQRVSLDDHARLKDTTAIKLNHALHLKGGLRGKDGPVTLQCSSCHELDKDFKSMKPIEFEPHCSSCHTLGFDQRLSSTQVPHGDDEAVYPALFTEYTKLLLLKGSTEQPKTNAEEVFQRSIPGGTSNVEKPQVSAGGDVSSVVRQARAAERELFTKTACFVCHNTTEKAAFLKTSTNSHYTVEKPKIPTRWLHKGIFGHGAHEEVSCESCHQGVRKSSNTTDVLMPGVKECKECHSQEFKRGFVKSDCTMCHSYHDSLGFPREKKKSIADYLALIRR